ncbi:hypothetical protein CKO51_07170 [Rhodopirellula sp. SM50]|nr:hypothetical protein [Rhodopirellula sp. SM50]PAY20209.1 hypothetical protein CKO51_07170 [Rhodopirellula sp. SM50]
MNQELPPGQESDEIQGLAEVVAKSLSEGEDPQTIAQKLVDSGWDPEEAASFVGSIEHHMMHAQHAGGGSEVQGWMLWGGGLIVINLLSWMFNWGFWIY